MKRLLLASAVLLSSCRAPAPDAPVAEAGPAVCRIGPDGARPPGRALADRGIGGTGAPLQVADRGIGGTGIIAVVTGFASVCLAGLEVGLDPATPVTVDGAAASPDVLRAGQVALIEAAGPASALQARQVTVRHEVIGPVSETGPDSFTVLGQVVIVTAGQRLPRSGDWVAVSGLRRPDGLILATRIDPARPGPVLLRGELLRFAGGASIGGQPLRLPDGNATPSGWGVTVGGQLAGGMLVVDAITRDRVLDNPAAVFDARVTNFYVEGFTDVLGYGRFGGPGPLVRGGDMQRRVSSFTREDAGRAAAGPGNAGRGEAGPGDPGRGGRGGNGGRFDGTRGGDPAGRNGFNGSDATRNGPLAGPGGGDGQGGGRRR